LCPNRAKEAILSCVGAVLYEDTAAKWHPSQPEPQEWTKTALNEARLKAEEDARRQQQAEEEARRLAEEERIQKAKADEEAREQAELVEHQKRAEETARAAAKAAEEEERRRLEEIEAARRRQRAKRTEQVVLQTSGVIAAVIVTGMLAYAFTGPYSEAEIARRRARVEKAEEQADSLDVERTRIEWEISHTKVWLKELPDLGVRRKRELEEAVARVAKVKDKLQKKQAVLNEYQRSPFRIPDRPVPDNDLWGVSAVEKCRKELREAEAKADVARTNLSGLPEQERRETDRAKRLGATAAEVNQKIAQQMQAVQSAQRDLSKALLRNKQWTW
jgi:hypothetical protein